LFAGCLNGGGQLRADDTDTSKELLERVQSIYSQPATRDPLQCDVIKTLYMEWLGGCESEKASAQLHTSYKEIEKLNNALTIKW